jgi:hypothetical protein
VSDDEIRAVLLDLAFARGRAKSFCPSEAAKRLAPDWRRLMPDIRRVAAGLAELRASQRGVEVDPLTARGAIRLSLRDAG